MKVLMVLGSDFPPDVRVEKEAVSLRHDGHEVVIACISNIKPDSTEFYFKEIRIFKKHVSWFIYKSSAVALQFPFYFHFWRKYIKLIRKQFDFDVIHIHDLPLASVGLYFKRKYASKLVVDLHENYPALIEVSPFSNNFPGNLLISIKKWRRYEKNILPSADLIITVIDEMKMRIIALGVDQEIIGVVPNMPLISEMGFSEAAPDENYITLFYSGGVNFHRGLQIVIEGLSTIVNQNRNVRLWIVGDGSYMSTIVEQVNTLNLNEYVTFYGWKPFDEMMKIQSIADITLIPHLRSEQSDNSSPNKLYEYMFQRKPIIASNCLSVERILNETGAGIIYNSTDPESFVLAFQKVISQDTREEMGDKGYHAVKSSLNWDTAERELTTLYKNRL